MTSLVLFSVPNGAELIGELINETVDILTVEHPFVIRPVQRGPNDFALDLFPHSLANPEGEHQFMTASIVSRSVKVPEPLEKAYRERTSNIVIAQTLNDWEGQLK